MVEKNKVIVANTYSIVSEMSGGKNVYKDVAINGGFIFWVEKYGLWVLAPEYPSERFIVINKVILSYQKCII